MGQENAGMSWTAANSAPFYASKWWREEAGPVVDDHSSIQSNVESVSPDQACTNDS